MVKHLEQRSKRGHKARYSVVPLSHLPCVCSRCLDSNVPLRKPFCLVPGELGSHVRTFRRVRFVRTCPHERTRLHAYTFFPSHLLCRPSMQCGHLSPVRQPGSREANNYGALVEVSGFITSFFLSQSMCRVVRSRPLGGGGRTRVSFPRVVRPPASRAVFAESPRVQQRPTFHRRPFYTRACDRALAALLRVRA